MFHYSVRRLMYMIPIMFGIALVTFALFNVVGLDPVLVMLGKHANAQSIADMRAELGLDRPMYMQFLDFLRQIVTFDFGRSYATKQEISTMILTAAPVSFSFAFPAFLISLVISVSTSLLVAFWRGTWVDRLAVLIGVIGISVPSLAYILAGQYFLAYQWGLFPISGYSSSIDELAYYVALPVLIWVTISVGGELRFYRTVMLDEVNQDYIRTARSKGLSERVVMFKHVLKNAMIPIITSVVIQLPFLITGSILIENFFGIPGLGSQLVDAFNTNDIPLIKAEVIIFSLLYMVFNLLTDLLYGVVDPRVSLK